MALAYFPQFAFIGVRCCIPFACLKLLFYIYTLMTLDSALRHWQGRGVAGKAEFIRLSFWLICDNSD